MHPAGRDSLRSLSQLPCAGVPHAECSTPAAGLLGQAQGGAAAQKPELPAAAGGHPTEWTKGMTAMARALTPSSTPEAATTKRRGWRPATQVQRQGRAAGAVGSLPAAHSMAQYFRGSRADGSRIHDAAQEERTHAFVTKAMIRDAAETLDAILIEPKTRASGAALARLLRSPTAGRCRAASHQGPVRHAPAPRR
jgi:hypothetical protein